MNQKMKTLMWITLITLLGGLLAVGCQSLISPNQPTTTGSQEPVAISWQEAQELILSGEVAQVSQTHALEVYLDMKDGSHYVAQEPAIDEVFAVIEQCGKPCADTILATE